MVGVNNMQCGIPIHLKLTELFGIENFLVQRILGRFLL